MSCILIYKKGEAGGSGDVRGLGGFQALGGGRQSGRGDSFGFGGLPPSGALGRTHIDGISIGEGEEMEEMDGETAGKACVRDVVDGDKISKMR